MQKLTEKLVREKLSEVLDPELNVSIVDLGLIYSVKIGKDKKVDLKMTLTTIGCPLFATIEQEVKAKLKEIDLPEDKVHIELTFEPPWTMDRLSERAKALLGI